MEKNQITIGTVTDSLKRLGGYRGIYIPEFTWGGYRIDAIVINTESRWIRGFEIKMNRSDFLRDEKWQHYAQFCSSLSVVCPQGIIKKEEVPDPFGLLVVRNEYSVDWVKKPRRFQKRDGLAWTYTYLDVIEKEFARVAIEKERSDNEMEYWKEQYNEIRESTKKTADLR